MVLSHAFVASDLTLVPGVMSLVLLLRFAVFTACMAVPLFRTYGVFSPSHAPQSGYPSTLFVLDLTFVSLVARLRFAWCLGFSVASAVEDDALPRGAPGAGRVVTLSVGVAAACPAKGGTPQSLIDAADEAPYGGKRAGRGRVHAAEPAAASMG